MIFTREQTCWFSLAEKCLPSETLHFECCALKAAHSQDENRDLQRQWNQQSAGQSFGLGAPGAAGRCMPSGIEDDRLRISDRRNQKSWLWRDLVRAEVVEWRRHSGSRL